MNNSLSAEQHQQLKDVGLRLQQVRQSQNISLEAIAEQTHISRRLLKAIEEADLLELPEPFYIEALANKYAAALGTRKVQLPSGFSNYRRTLDKTQAAKSTPNIGRRKGLSFQLRSLHLYLLYIVLVIVSVSGISFLLERPVIVKQSPNSPEATEAKQSDTITLETTSVNLNPTQPQLVSQSSSSEEVSVGIDLQEECWLKVMVDGRVAFEGLLAKGTKRQWTGQKEVTLRAGNAGGVVISFNNQQQKVLGAPGQVEEITYTLN